ncbi:MAG: aromatic ring-hydroxylating dioxygenase subunit alpha [Halioglobus sp.]
MQSDELLRMSQEALAHGVEGTLPLAENVLKIPASDYYDEQRWQDEMKKVFGRLPLMLAASIELPKPMDYKAMEAAGVPILITRDTAGEVQAYVNSCAHRGSQIMREGCGSAKRFTCPYHAWSYNHAGELTHIYAPKDFGDIDKSQYGLVPLKAVERAGLIWVLTDPNSELDIDTFLSGYDKQLQHFSFENYHFFASNTVKGPNWKIAYDGYLDFYHLPILHKETFGGEISSQAMYYGWGPHQRVMSPETVKETLADIDEKDWTEELLLRGVWTIFPHISIASFGEGESLGVLLSQLFPGEKPGESITIQMYLMAKEPSEEVAEEARAQFEMLKYVVEVEDYATGIRQQDSLQTGVRDHVLFGRNEEGGQNFHGWLKKILDADTEQLNDLFSRS